jgi:hypothetical protein
LEGEGVEEEVPIDDVAFASFSVREYGGRPTILPNKCSIHIVEHVRPNLSNTCKKRNRKFDVKHVNNWKARTVNDSLTGNVRIAERVSRRVGRIGSGPDSNWVVGHIRSEDEVTDDF